MSEPATESSKRARRRWINFGEFIALAALIVSALGLWNGWARDDKPSGPSEVIEKKSAIPLILRGKPDDEGRRLVITPVEDSHALESLSLAFPGATTIELGADGALSARDLEHVLGDSRRHEGDGKLIALADANYVEMGSERRSQRRYAILYRWQGGGIFGGKSLRLTGFRRA